MQKSAFYNHGAEISAIGCFLTSEKATRHASELTREDFHDPKARAAFAAIQQLLSGNKTVDLATVDEAIGGNDPEMLNFLIDASAYVPSAANVKAYIDIVREKALARRAYTYFEQAQRDISDPMQDTREVIERVRLALRQITDGKQGWMAMDELLLKTYASLEERVKGAVPMISTGVDNLNQLIGGFFPGEMTVVGARPSKGKTAFGINAALAAAEQGFRVCVCSCEMTDTQLGQRVMSNDSGVDGMRMRTGTLEEGDWVRLADTLCTMSPKPISFLFKTRTIEDLRSQIQQRAETEGVDMLVVDYLQLMQTRKQIRENHLRVGHISKELKFMATDFNIPVIVLAQVGRTAEGEMPVLSELRDSGEIEQDADNVIFIHNPTEASDKYVDPRDKPYLDQLNANGQQYVSLGAAKQRQGRTGRACVIFRPANMRYVAIDRTRTA